MAQERNDIEKFDRAEESGSAQEIETVSGLDETEAAFDDRTEQLKDEIDETRTQMGETIDAIQDKLSFPNLSEQVSDHVTNAVETAKDAVYDATIGKVTEVMKNIGSDISGSSIVKTAKNNPLPFLLIGAGAGLLAYQAYAGKTKKGHTRLFDVAGKQPHTAGTEGSVIDSAKEKLSSATDKVSDVAGTALNKVTGAAVAVYSGTGEAVTQAYGKLGDLGSSVRGQYDTQIQDHPLAVGAVALALGAAVGMAIPATRYEGQLLGNARQDLLDKAQSTATDMIDKAKEVVSEAGHNIGEHMSRSAGEGQS